MTRVKSKKRLKEAADQDINNKELRVIFGELSGIKKHLWMKVYGGTKLRNVIGYALKEYAKFDGNVLWTGTGQGGISKVITCVEIFKRKNSELHQMHQMTKLRYININKEASPDDKQQRIPEINILLSKKALLSDCKCEAE